MDSKLLPEDRIVSFKRLGSHNEWYTAKVIEWSREGLLLGDADSGELWSFLPWHLIEMVRWSKVDLYKRNQEVPF